MSELWVPIAAFGLLIVFSRFTPRPDMKPSYAPPRIQITGVVYSPARNATVVWWRDRIDGSSGVIINKQLRAPEKDFDDLQTCCGGGKVRQWSQ